MRALLSSPTYRWTIKPASYPWIAAALVLTATVAVLFSTALVTPENPRSSNQTNPASDSKVPVSSSTGFVFSKGKWEAAGLEIGEPISEPWSEDLWVTGRLQLNADRVAHIHSPVSGVVREVNFSLGQSISTEQVLAFIDSREVGLAKLELVRNRQNLELAETKNEWLRTIQKNTEELISVLQTEVSVAELEKTFHDRPMGSYRDQLVSAYALKTRSEVDFQRLSQLRKDGVVPEKEFFQAKSTYESANASYLSKLEQCLFDAQQELRESDQQVQQAVTAASVSRSQLLIYGLKVDDADMVDLRQEGEKLAYYPVRAPFAGTILSKDLTLAEHVSPDMELFQIADLSTLWLQINVFEKDLVATRSIDGNAIEFRTDSYPEKVFTARLFSSGNMVDESTRSLSMMAVVDNNEGLLNAGMFANVNLSSRASQPVLTLPDTALQRHAGEQFVFVQRDDETFEKQLVTIGRHSDAKVEILDGLKTSDKVVTQGGFALKSEMLRELLAEE